MNSFAAGPLIFGGRGGASITDNTNLSFGGVGLNAPGRSYLVGPTAGVRLPLGFSVEGDALYNRQTLGFGQIVGLGGISTHSDWWEFPVMLRFTAGHGAVAPVFGAGVSVRHINNFGDIPSYVLTGSTNANTVGFVAGGGVRFKAGPVGITPEFRYTRWNSSSLAQSLLDTLTGHQNQAQVMVGITF